MKTWTQLSQVPTDFGPTVVTIGKFDGIHLGHQALLKRAVDEAAKRGIASVMITFDRHPDALFRPELVRVPLIGPTQKELLVAETGIDGLLTLEFNNQLAGLEPEEFVQQVLLSVLHAKVVVVGPDFRFGHKGAGNTQSLMALGQQLGFEVVVLPEVEVEGVRVSTSNIRQLLDQGDVVGAAKLLGRVHRTTGMVEHGLKLGRQLGFPTANLSRESEGFLPLDGVYGGWLYSDGVRYPAALSVGINETIQAVPRLIEAHVLGTKDLDLYDKVVHVDYISFIRPAAKFDGMDTLIKAIQADCDEIQRQLSTLS
jgi:riboflavin kinase/FMN adenylyltransferase